MKKLNFVIALLFFALTTLLFACGGGGAEGAQENKENVKLEIKTDGPEYTSAFICPMHCEGSGSAAAGKCPKCGMDYVANEKKAAGAHDGHDHDHDHDDHSGHSH